MHVTDIHAVTPKGGSAMQGVTERYVSNPKLEALCMV